MNSYPILKACYQYQYAIAIFEHQKYYLLFMIFILQRNICIGEKYDILLKIEWVNWCGIQDDIAKWVGGTC